MRVHLISKLKIPQSQNITVNGKITLKQVRIKVLGPHSATITPFFCWTLCFAVDDQDVLADYSLWLHDTLLAPHSYGLSSVSE